MFASGVFDYVDVLNKAADASYYRNDLISNNIANVDTPGYKRQDLEFETYLQSAIDSAGKENDSLSTKIHNMDLDSVRMVTYTDNASYSYREDENNVDIATENVELATNQIVYNTLIDSMSNEFTRMKSVLD